MQTSLVMQHSQFPVSFVSTVCTHVCRYSHDVLIHVCCHPVCRFMLLILPVLRGLPTPGRWSSGESTPPTLNSSLDQSTRGIAVFEILCVELTNEFIFQCRVTVLHPLPPGTAVAATKPLGNFTHYILCMHACSTTSTDKIFMICYDLNYPACVCAARSKATG